jgi:hypothetical protein
VGLTEDQMRHLADDALPDGVYDAARRRSSATPEVDAARADRRRDIRALARHFSTEQIMDICLTVGLSNMVNRFHATFLTDVDEETIAEVEAGDRAAGSCPIPRPKPPRGRLV